MVDGSDVTLAWPPGLQGSAFDVNYRVVSQDGHPVSGQISFTTTAAEAPSSAPPASTSPAAPVRHPVAARPRPPVRAARPSPRVVAALAVGLAVVGLFLLRGRRSPTP